MGGENRIAYIDGLRGVAVLSVVIYHTWSTAPAIVAKGTATWSAARFGDHGVDLFFILSGFCLAYPTLAKTHTTGNPSFDVARYAARRVVRILPPYYFAVALFVLVGLVLRHMDIATPYYMLSTITPYDVLHALLFINADQRFINSSFWSLPIELRWYVVFPIVLYLWSRSRTAFWFVLAIAFVYAFTQISNTVFSWLFAFMLGIVASELQIRGHRITHYAIFSFLALLMLCVVMTPSGFLLNRPNPLWQLDAFLLVVSAGGSPFIVRVLSSNVLVALGAASYSIYLVHAHSLHC